MRTAVIPLACTSVDWEVFQRVTGAVIGRSVTRPMDERSIAARGAAEALAALGEFQQARSEYSATLREAGSLLKHLSASFLVVCDDRDLVFEVAVDGDLKVLDCGDCDRIFVLSASLEGWRTTLINFAAPRATRGQRLLAGELLQAFDRMGLGRIWENYSRGGGAELTLTEKR